MRVRKVGGEGRGGGDPWKPPNGGKEEEIRTSCPLVTAYRHACAHSDANLAMFFTFHLVFFRHHSLKARSQRSLVAS